MKLEIQGAIDRLNAVLAEARRILGPSEGTSADRPVVESSSRRVVESGGWLQRGISKPPAFYAHRLEGLLEEVRICHFLRDDEALPHYRAGAAKALDVLAQVRAERGEEYVEIAGAMEKVHQFMARRLDQIAKATNAGAAEG